MPDDADVRMAAGALSLRTMTPDDIARQGGCDSTRARQWLAGLPGGWVEAIPCPPWDKGTTHGEWFRVTGAGRAGLRGIIDGIDRDRLERVLEPDPGRGVPIVEEHLSWVEAVLDAADRTGGHPGRWETGEARMREVAAWSTPWRRRGHPVDPALAVRIAEARGRCERMRGMPGAGTGDG